MMNFRNLLFFITGSIMLLACKPDVNTQNASQNSQIEEKKIGDTIIVSNAEEPVKHGTKEDSLSSEEISTILTNGSSQSKNEKPDKPYSENEEKQLSIAEPTKQNSPVVQKEEKREEVPKESITENSLVNEVDLNEEPFQEKEVKEEEIQKQKSKNYLEDLETILTKHVSAKGVDYKQLKINESKLDAVLATMTKNPPSDKEARNNKLAYWINLYNVATLKLIIKNFPISSITDLHGGKPWDVKWIEVNGEILSLNNIENDIIRPRFKEPRIHFAVNCAAKSCPPLLNHAFNPSTLDIQLEKQTKAFLSNSAYNTITESSLKLSKIFDWYGSDFDDLKSFISNYTAVDISQANLTFQDYDWALNSK